MKDITSSKLWKNIKDIDVELLMEKSGAGNEVMENYQKITETVESVISKLKAEHYFGREVILALYPLAADKDEIEAEDFLACPLLVTRAKHNGKLADAVVKAAGELGKKVDVKTEKFNESNITTLIFPDKSELFYVNIKEMIFISFSKDRLHECIEISMDKKKSLADESLYQETMSNLPSDAEAYIYLEYENYGRLLKDAVISFQSQLVSEIDAEFTDEFKKTFEEEIMDQMDVDGQIQGLKSFAMASKIGKISVDKSVTLYDRDKLNLLYKSIMELKSRKSNAVKSAPKDTMAFAWMTIDIEKYWQALKEELKKGMEVENAPSIDEALASVKEETGIDIEGKLIPPSVMKLPLCLPI